VDRNISLPAHNGVLNFKGKYSLTAHLRQWCITVLIALGVDLDEFTNDALGREPLLN